jgi:hypothetical protein
VTIAARTLRALLLRAAGDELLAPLGPWASFEGLTALWDAGWLSGGEVHPARAGRVTSARIRRQLRVIAGARRSIASAALLAAGAAALLEGTVAGLGPLCLEDGSGERVWVPEPPAIFVGGPARARDRVTVLGFVDHQLDPGLPPRGPRQAPARLLIRPARLPLVAMVAAAGKDRARTIP